MTTRAGPIRWVGRSTFATLFNVATSNFVAFGIKTITVTTASTAHAASVTALCLGLN